MPVHPLNALSPISEIDLGIVNEVSSEHPLNASFSIAVTKNIFSLCRTESGITRFSTDAELPANPVTVAVESSSLNE